MANSVDTVQGVPDTTLIADIQDSISAQGIVIAQYLDDAEDAEKQGDTSLASSYLAVVREMLSTL